MGSLSAAQARNAALAAQGFGGPAPRRVTVTEFLRVARRLAVMQIDSVNVLVRSHYLPAFSRLGPYPRELLARVTYREKQLFETWAHEASLAPVELHPLLRWRMQQWATRAVPERLRVWLEKSQPFLDDVLAEVAKRGPLTASELTHPGTKSGPWWGWSQGKQALEWLFATGELAVEDRRNFERVYDIAERVIPRHIIDQATPPETEARKSLLMIAAKAIGVGTAGDISDYFRMKGPMVRQLFIELVEEGELLPVNVEGWKKKAFTHKDVRIPRKIEAAALLSPFDSLVWERDRVQRLFGFHYRIEIYTPIERRVHGYYVLPFLFGDTLAGRVDLKADRANRILQVKAAFPEPGYDRNDVAAALAGELAKMQRWLELERTSIEGFRGFDKRLAKFMKRAA